jgi:hypothetical protein
MPSAPTLHAISMLSLLGVTLAACALLLRRGERPRTFAATVTALCAIVIVFLAAPVHLCHAGQPVAQALLGIICVPAPVLLVRGDRLAFALAGLVGIATFSLMNQYVALVHTERVTGNCSRSDTNLRLDRLLAEVGAQLSNLGAAETFRFPEGWLSDVEFVRKAPGTGPLEAALETFERESFSPFWHSGFTKLYARHRTPVGLWFPGGTLAEGGSRLEWRERAGN